MVKVKEKVKSPLCLTKHHAMKTHRGSGGVAPLVLNFDTRRRWVDIFVNRTLYASRKRAS